MAGTASSGRRRKPNALKRLSGSRKPKNVGEPTYATGVPPCPDHLEGEARAEWTRIVADPELSKVLTRVDGQVLAQYCLLHADSVVIARAKAHKGFAPLVLEPTIDMDGGTHMKAKANPLVTMGRQTAQMLKAYLVEFGWTPASRARVKVSTPEPVDEFEKFEVIEGGKSS